MSFLDGPPTGKCQSCGVRDATVWFAVDEMAFTRGGAEGRCKVCAITGQLEERRNLAATIPALEAELAGLLAAERGQR